MRSIKFLWLLVVTLLFIQFGSNVVYAILIYDSNYIWYSSGGTRVTPVGGEEWTVGDVNGDGWYQLTEKVFAWDATEALKAPSGTPEGSYRYQYSLTRIGALLGAPEVFDVHIDNLYGVEGIGQVPWPMNMFWHPDWSGYTAPPEWSWSTPPPGDPYSAPANGEGLMIQFQIWTPAPRGYVSGYVTTIDPNNNTGRIPVVGENWVISGPVPEPGTLLLLGSGLLGLAGYAWKRKKS